MCKIDKNIKFLTLQHTINIIIFDYIIRVRVIYETLTFTGLIKKKAT